MCRNENVIATLFVSSFKAAAMKKESRCSISSSPLPVGRVVREHVYWPTGYKIIV